MLPRWYAATDLKSIKQRVCPSGGKTPPPCRGGGPQGRRGFPCTRVTSPLFPTRLCCPWMRPVLFPWAWDPLRPFGARPPARRDSSFLSALTADIHLRETPRHTNSSIHFPDGVKSPQKIQTDPKQACHTELGKSHLKNGSTGRFPKVTYFPKRRYTYLAK